MKVVDVVLAIALEILSWVLAPLVPFVVPFARRVRTDRLAPAADEEYPQPLYVDRLELPRWAYVWSTPDELLPGGMYEPTVRKIYAVFGWYLTSVYWLGWRNRCYGLSWLFGRPASDYLDPVPGIVERGRLWRGWWKLGPLPLVAQAGWKVHRKDWHADHQLGPFWAIPFVSLRLLRNS